MPLVIGPRLKPGWSSLLRDLRAVTVRFARDDGPLLAAGLAFALLVCLAPLVLMFFAVAGFLMESDQIAEFVFDTALLALPAYGHDLAEFFNLLVKERTVAGVIGVASWAVFATQLFSLTRAVLNRAFRVERRRGFLHGFTVDLLGVLLAATLVVGLSALMLTLAALGTVATSLGPGIGGLWATAERVAAPVLIYLTAPGLVFFAYRTLPNTHVPARAAAVGALVVAVAWEIARWGFTAYVGLFGTYGRLYGSFGIGVAALVWLYLAATIFVLGAELAADLAERMKEDSAPGPRA